MVSKTNGKAILALAQLSYASHLKSSTRLNTKAQQQDTTKASYTPKQELIYTSYTTTKVNKKVKEWGVIVIPTL